MKQRCWNLTQNHSKLSWRKQNLQAAAEERKKIVSIRGAEVRKQLLLSVAEGRLLCSVEGYNLIGHLTGDNSHHNRPDPLTQHRHQNPPLLHVLAIKSD